MDPMSYVQGNTVASSFLYEFTRKDKLSRKDSNAAE